MRGAFRYEDGIALGGECRACKLADGCVILDEEDGFRSPLIDRLVCLNRWRHAGFLDAREIDLEGCAFAGLAVNPNVAAALLDDAVDGGEAQSGPAAASLGGVARLEDIRLGFRIPCAPDGRNRARGRTPRAP